MPDILCLNMAGLGQIRKYIMQSLYWVLTWACHRKCKHCYDDRFRPYVRDALSEVVGEGQKAYEAIIANLPDDMTWLDESTGKRERTLLLSLIHI